MRLLDRFRHKEVIKEKVVLPPKGKSVSPSPVDGIFLPAGCSREEDMIIVKGEYTAQWIEKYPDKIEAVKQMLAFLKKQYPAVSNFHIRK